jgi:hypothetical protein
MIGRRPTSPDPWKGWARPVRLVTLAGVALFLLWAATRLGEPRRWVWWETELGSQPTTAAPSRPTVRRAPIPDSDLLRGALDHEPFWAESASNPLRGPAVAPRRRDTDARYHLLLLARAAVPETLIADAEPCPPVAELLGSPDRHRGRLFRVQGHLFGLRRMKLTRGDLPGRDSCFQAFLTVGTTQDRLLVLFTDLPAAALPAEEEWPRLWRRDVAAAGYFLKIVRIDHPQAGAAPVHLPVLVAQTLLLPPTEEPAAGFVTSNLWLFALMAGPVVLILVCLAWMWRREDGPWQRRRRRLEARLADQNRGMTVWPRGEGERTA